MGQSSSRTRWKLFFQFIFWFEFYLLTLLSSNKGTLRPDLIESASHMASSRADAIKTHHNDSEMVRQLRLHGRVVEPLKGIFEFTHRIELFDIFYVISPCPLKTSIKMKFEH